MGGDSSKEGTAEQKVLETKATQHAGMYLRSSATHLLNKAPYLPLGSRPTEKIFFLVNSNDRKQEERLMMMVKKPEISALDLKVEANKAVFCGLLEGFKHPYILPILEADYIPEKDFLVVFRPLSKSGSIRDLVHNAKPRDSYDKKYAKAGKPFSLRLISEFGRQILEALLFLRSRRIPYPHLHSGNVILDREKKTCRLTDIESALIGLEPRYAGVLAEAPARDEVDVEVLCFGHVLYEMAAGFELSVPVLDCVPSHVYREVGEVLEGIFGGQLTSVKELLRHPLFADVVPKEDLTDVSPPLSSTEKDLLKSAKKGKKKKSSSREKKPTHSSKTISSTLTPEDAAWTGGVAENINAVRPPEARTYFSNDGPVSPPQSTQKPPPPPPPAPAPAEKAQAALPAPSAPPQAETSTKGGRGAEPAPVEEPAAAAPDPAVKGGKGGKGKAPPGKGGKGAGASDKLAKLRAAADAKPAVTRAPSNMSADAAAGATFNALNDLGSPEAVLAMLKKAKKPAKPKKELSFKEQLAAKFAR